MALLKNFYVDTTKGIDCLNIIHEVRRVIREANAQNGMVLVVVPNPGAALVVLGTDDPLFKIEDLKKTLEPYVSDRLIHCFLPKSVVLPLENGKLQIEPFQGIFLIDYEVSGRRREFKVQVVSEAAPEAGQQGAPGGQAPRRK